MPRNIKLILLGSLITLLAAVALGAYVQPDPGGRDGHQVNTVNGNLVHRRAGVIVSTTSSTGGATYTDLTCTDDLIVGDDAAIAGLMTVGETLGVTGITTCSALLNANGGIAVDTNAFTVADTTGITTVAGIVNANGGIAVDTNAFTVADATGSFASAGSGAVAGGMTFVAQTLGMDFSDFRIFDNIDAILDQAAADDDDLTLIQGTFGTVATTIETIDCGGLADTAQKGSFWFVVPATYLAGSTVTLTTNVGMVTAVADQEATLDFSCYVPDYANEDATVSSDLITTAATSINFTTFADYDFVLDDDAVGYELDAGALVQCQVTALCDDDGDAGPGITVRINRLDVVVST